MDNQDLIKIYKDIEDYLIPFLKLDPYERSLYYFLLRQTRLIDKSETIFVITTAHKNVGITDFTARDRLRKMDKKGCIQIMEVRRDGLKISVFLPSEIDECVAEKIPEIQKVDIEDIDFYNEQRYRESILKRENGECFYCLRKITKENYVLDHLTSQVNGGNNSYKNIVASCHECNSVKSGKNGEDYARDLYRKGALSQKELEQRLIAVEAIKNGEIKPEV